MDNLDFSHYLDKGMELAMEYAPKVLLALIVLIVGLRIIKVLQKVIRKACDKSKLDDALKSFLGNLSGWLMKILLFIAVADMMGVATTSFVAIIGAAGLAVGLALQGTLANFAGGVLILIFKPYKIGDLVESQGVLGVVKEVQIFNTILLTPENKTVIMPNGAVMNNHITNYTEEGMIRVDTSVGISYNADIKKAKEVLEATLTADPRVLKEPAPTVAVAELGDSSVNLVVRPWCDPAEYWNVYFDTLENCKIALDNAGIGIPFPQRDVHIYNHN
ncbi:MAG: mechanosensitive ion channel [Flavobacteriales bacterium]|nr:mechanosensitive ion channel [Flavobacteriales bacterium]